MKIRKKSKAIKQVEVYRDHLAGVQFSDYQRANLKAGMPLTLVWERSNAYDPRAIAVYAGDYRIGYVKKNKTEELHALRETGKNTAATLVSYNKNNPSWNAIVISVCAVGTDEDLSDIKF